MPVWLFRHMQLSINDLVTLAVIGQQFEVSGCPAGGCAHNSSPIHQSPLAGSAEGDGSPPANSSHFSSALSRDHDAFGFEVIIERLGAVLAPEAARLDAAERQLVVAVMQRIHPDVARLYAINRRLDVIEVLRPNGRAKSVDRIIGLRNGF